VDLPPEARELFALPPPRFTAERNALAAALAARGDPRAPRVRKLARPLGLAWVLNRLAREGPDEVQALLEAGDRLRAGQRRAVSGGGPEALREADAALRVAARALRLRAGALLAAEGRPAPDALLARVELLLRLAATGPDREPFREASLGREPAAPVDALSGFAVVAGGPDPAQAARGTRTAALPAAAREARDREERRRAEREAREAERSRRERARALAKARADAGRAEKAAAAAERRAREARATADRLAARAREMEREGGED
jgi:hypothetical protein